LRFRVKAVVLADADEGDGGDSASSDHLGSKLDLLPKSRRIPPHRA
jgi:hypothetical protein